MLVLLWIVRIYRWWMFGWVLLTWIPGIAGSPFHMLLGAPVLPVLNLFNFLSFGGIGFGALIPLYALYALDSWLSKTIHEQKGAAAGQQLLPQAADYPLPDAAQPQEYQGGSVTDADPPA